MVKDAVADAIDTQRHSKETDEFLNAKQAAKFLGLSVSTIYQKVHLGTIPHFKRNSRLYFSKADLTSYIKSGEINSVDPSTFLK